MCFLGIESVTEKENIHAFKNRGNTSFHKFYSMDMISAIIFILLRMVFFLASTSTDTTKHLTDTSDKGNVSPGLQ